MIKKITSLLIFLFLLNGCSGYKPIFSSENLNFEIINHVIEGDKILGNKIYSQLNQLSKLNNNQNKKGIDLYINVTKDNNAATKNSAGEILSYKTTLIVKIEVKDYLTNEKILEKDFVSSSTYKTQDQYYDTIKLENETNEILLETTYENILITLTQYIS